MTPTHWMIRGPEFSNCNCDYGCPCQFSARPTHGHCHAVQVARIDEGRFGDVVLDGLTFVNLYSWPSAVHEGNGTHRPIIDERADADQREALLSILLGKHSAPGATVFAVFASTVTQPLEPLYLPIELQIDMERRRARYRVPGLVEGTGEPIRNPVTGAEHDARVVLPAGFEYHEALYASGTTRSSDEIALELTGSHGHFALLHMTQDGVVH